MKKYPIILSIAGSDCSGGAGIQADLKTISALGGYAATAITAITVQNTIGVHAIHAIPPSIVRGQIEAVMEDLHPDAIKIGMINDIKIARTIAQCIQKFHPKHIIFDPVMASTSGHKLIENIAIEVLKHELIPLASLITPNLNEAEVLTGESICNVEQMKKAAKDMLRWGCKAVLLKGGHLKDEKMCDVLQIANENHPHIFCLDKIESANTHGTGCTLSSAIATLLALGQPICQAVEHAKDYVTSGIKAGKDVHTGLGHGPLNHFYSPVPMHIQEKLNDIEMK